MESLQWDRRCAAFASPTGFPLSPIAARPNVTHVFRRRAARTAKFRMTADARGAPPSSPDATDAPPTSSDATEASPSPPDAPPSQPEAWEVTLPQPPVPKEPLDLTLGTETAVLSVDATTPVTTDSWLQSVLIARPSIAKTHPLAELRAHADEQLPQIPIPNRKMESWRFTDLRPVYSSRYVSVPPADALESFDIRQYAPDTCGAVLVFVDGVYDESLSLINDDSANEWKEAGGYFGSVSNYTGDLTEVRKVLSSGELGSEGEEALFPTVTHAIATDAAILKIPQDFSVSRPVAVVFVSTAGESEQRAKVAGARLAVIAELGSKVCLLETHVSLDEVGSYTTTMATTGVRVKDSATVRHYFVNDYCPDAHLMASVHSEVSSGGTYELRGVGMGSRVGRLTAGVDLNGGGSHALVHGALIAESDQITDIHSRICHNAKGTSSDQLQKNVASENGRTIFRGRIIVTEQGEQTDSSQLCNSLLLSDKATVDAMPVLEIANDDVVCSHGATVSDLEDDQLFYCQSRGLTHKEAQYLLISGFALSILGDCPYPSLRERIESKVDRVALKSLKGDRGRGEYMSI